PLLLAMPTGYSHSEFLHTSETIEFILDFSTGLMTGYGKLCESRSVQIEGLVFSAKKGSYPVNQDRRTGIFLRKMMPPGTISVISVPEFEELLRVSFPLMRAARSRIPCSPKCPSLPPSAKARSIPAPLSFTRKTRLFVYLRSTSN